MGPLPPLFFAKLRPEGAKKVFGRPPPPVPLSKGLDDRGPALSQVLDPALLTDHSQMYSFSVLLLNCGTF